MELESKEFWVYILENRQGKFYIGSTGNYLKRLEEHNSLDKDLTKYTHKNGPWSLVWKQKHDSRASAMRQEKRIKSMKSSKWIRKKLLGRDN